MLTQTPLRFVIALLSTVVLGACGSDEPTDRGNSGRVSPQESGTFGDANALQCALNDPKLLIGEGLDSPSVNRPGPSGVVPQANSGLNSGACRNNTEFQLGTGIVDITGPAAGSVMMGYESPTHTSSGLHTRQFSRAFVFGSPCNGKRVVYVSNDLGMIFHAVRQGVLDRVAADATLSKFYNEQNIMLNATHTHAGPGGYAHFFAFNAFRLGHDEAVYNFIVDGIVEAIRRAHTNLEANPEPGRVLVNNGELLNANVNRSAIAYDQNPEEERKRYLNARGESQNVNKEMALLKMRRADGTPIGQINWFGVHPTTVGNTTNLISSDNKGWASLMFERIMGTRYDAPAGQDTFVAAFAQTDEGDSSPNVFFQSKPFAERGGSADELESVAINGSKQLARALTLYRDANKTVRGGVNFAQFHVKMDAVEVTDPVVLAGLQHPSALDTPVKKTCTAAMGVSFGAGAEDGPGPTVEGASCADRLNPDRLSRDLAALAAGKLPPEVLASAVLCNVSALPFDAVPSGTDTSCHAEKPVLFVLGPPLNFSNNVLPFQLFTIGNVAILGLPWEITTMAGRRIRETVLQVLEPQGIDQVIISGLSNDFVNYLTTREEYSIQQYEGASVQFGPWTLAAVQQESRRLALALAQESGPPQGPPRTVTNNPVPRPPYLPFDIAPGNAFGDVLAQPAQQVRAGERVQAQFQSAHPRNMTERGLAYAEVERQDAQGQWRPYVHDRQPELIFRWEAPQAELYNTPIPFAGFVSTATVEWRIPANTPAGTYRIKHRGVAMQGEAQAFESTSNAFEVQATGARCLYAAPVGVLSAS
ncbi:MAG TPA: neutral/alkaline non-lysosomal ceramidase N-terminal domain-containing protein [Limnobacter sp.]|nr:neutral/alkaline non-lysosomal ceramidase N-terminal domain-containing protein [Limnobacter sp.]